MKLQDMLEKWENEEEKELTEEELTESSGYFVKTGLKAGQCPTTYTYSNKKGGTCYYGCS